MLCKFKKNIQIDLTGAGVAQWVQWLGYGLGDRVLIPSRGREVIFLFATASRPALGPKHPCTQGAPGDLSSGAKWLRREADYWHLSSAEVKNAWNYPSTPPVRLRGVVLSYALRLNIYIYFDLSLKSFFCDSLNKMKAFRHVCYSFWIQSACACFLPRYETRIKIWKTSDIPNLT